MKEIKLQELSTDFVYAEQGEPGNIQFKAKNNNAAYAWAFGDGNTANSEAVTTNLYNKSGQYMVQLLAENSIGCKDTVKKRVEISLPVSIVEETITPDTTINSIPAYTAPEIKLEKREKDFVKNIDVENDSISISLYDNGIIDGDSITLVYNNEIILAHQLLSSKPLTLYLKVDPNRSSNELLMYAENLGSIPPNTALMIIKDGNKRHEVNVSSNKTTNGVISFTIKR
jgi:PKD repeat protein